MTDTLLSKQRNKILEKFADHILKEDCQHCHEIVRQALIINENKTTHCSKCGEWLDNSTNCPECGYPN